MFIRGALAAAALMIACPAAAAGIGDNVADIQFTTVFGKEMKLGDLRGEVVVLTYWMTDCKVCEDQLDLLDHYYRARRNVGLRVMAISPELLSGRQIRDEFDERMIHPLTSVRGDLGPRNGVPTTYIIDRSGKLQYAAAGALGLEELNRILVPLLKEPQP
ncbi:MAG: TlpA family protein disulfide reductase [Sphingomonas sp.]|nr:TlpA family protein disulfide reductase [Sphingomonas sp.]